MKKIMVLTFLLLMLTAHFALAGEQTGNQILIKMDQEMKVTEKYMEEEMILYTASGSQRKRTVAVWNKKTEDQDNMLIKFLEPANISGTGFLMKDDDMWLYLPALGKVKRIAGSAKQGSFMGSDLSYEDMEALGNSGFTPDFNAELTGEEQFKGRDVYLLQLTPKNDEISYGRLELMVDKEMSLPMQIIYYDRSGEKIKQLTTYLHQQIEGHWMAGKLEMIDLSKGSKTILSVNKVDFAPGIDQSIFSTRFLERGK